MIGFKHSGGLGTIHAPRDHRRGRSNSRKTLLPGMVQNAFIAEIPVSMLPILQPLRYKSFRGGRGSAKSHTVARYLICRSMSAKHRILCGREVQKSIADSVKRLLDDVIAEYGWGKYFYSTKTGIKCLRTGSEFLFSGMADKTSENLKSFEGVTIVWIEEAQRLSKRSWTLLTPTIRKSGSEIIATWNPDLETDETYVRTITTPWLPPEKMIDIEINWRDNPWFPEVLQDERLRLKALNDDLYQHVWEGKPRTLAGLLFKRAWIDANRYDPDELPDDLEFYQSSDYASTDLEDLEEEGQSREPDWTELGIFGLQKLPNGEEIIWIVDWKSMQEDPNKWITTMVKQGKLYDIDRHFEESGVIYRSTKGAINQKMRQLKAFFTRTPLPSTGSKADRAQGFAARVAAGAVKFPASGTAEWVDRLVEQLCGFTGQDGKVDDMVDTCSKLAQGLDMMHAKVQEPEPVTKNIVPFTEAHFMHDDSEIDDAAVRRYHEP